MKPYLPILLSFGLLAPPHALLHAQTRVAFDDEFSNDELLVNPGTGGDWIRADQGARPDPGLADSESGGLAILASSEGGWNIGGIKTTESFLAGSTVTVVLQGLEVIDGSSAPADRGNGLPAFLQGIISIADHNNAEAFPSAFKNDGRAALHIEIQESSGVWGFVIHRQGAANNSSVVDSVGVFDQAVTDSEPLEVTVSVSPAGEYSVDFNLTRDGGDDSPVTGSLERGFEDARFIVAIGSQGMNDNTGYARFGRVTVHEVEAIPLAITAHPRDQRAVQGDTVSFSVAAVGTGELRYQWLRGTTEIAGATDATLVLNEVTPGDAGEYSVRVSDDTTAVSSDPATLEIRAVVAALDDDFANGNPETNPGAGGGWLQANQADPWSPHEESDSRLTIYSGPSGWNIGGLQSANAFPAGTPFEVAIDVFQLTGDFGFRANRGAALNGAALGHITIVDARNANPFPGTYANAELAAVDVEIVLRDDGSAGYDIRLPVFDGNPGSHGDAPAQSGDLDWDGVSPLIVTAVLNPDGSYLVHFNVTRDNGNAGALVGSVGREVAAVALAIGAQGVGENTSLLMLGHARSVDPANLPLAIGSPPRATLAIAGHPVSFSVVAVGVPPLSYQWRRNGSPIEGATSDTLTFPAVSLEDAGSYSVVVSSGSNELTSEEATLTVIPPGVLFEDEFDDSDPFTNEAGGVTWLQADQGGGPDAGVDYTESEGVVRLPSSAGGWNIGGIKTTNIFPAGARVTAVLADIEIVDGSGAPADRGNGIQALVQAQVSVTDAANAEAYPSAYKNDGRPAMNIEIQFNGEQWGFDIQSQGPANNSSVVDSAGIFDNPITPDNPLSISILVRPDGSYEVTFDAPYDGGNTGPLTGHLGAGFGGSAFLVALGSQGINENAGHAVFESIRVVAEAPSAPVPGITIARDAAELVLTWEGSAGLQSAPSITGPWTTIPEAEPGFRISPGEGALFFRLQIP